MKKININGVIGLDVRSSDIIKQTEDAGLEDKLYEIHSPGGSVMEGLAIYNAIRQAEGRVQIRVLGLAASMASVIAMAKGKPEITKRSVFMMHNAQMFASGDYRVLQKAADLSNKVSDMLASIYAENSKKSKKQIRQMMDEETYLFGEQIKNEGFGSSVYDDGKEDKEDDAIAMAQLEMEEMINRMQGYKEDFSMAAQLIEEFVQIENPYPNEHAARIRQPGDFEENSFRRKNIETGIDIIIGKLKGKTTTTTQAYRFKKDKFTADEAKKWLKDHDVKYISFEAASGEQGKNEIGVNDLNNNYEPGFIYSNNTNNEHNPATDTRDNNSKEVLTMTLKEFLAQDPAAKIEYDNAIAEAKQAGKQEVRDIVAKAAPFVGNAEYPKQISEAAVAVIKGEKPVEVLDTMAATADMIKELKNSQAAVDETKQDTNGNGGDQTNQLSAEYLKNGTIMNQADMIADEKRRGMEVK